MLTLMLIFNLIFHSFPQANAQFAIRGYVRNNSGQAVGNLRVSLLDEYRQTLKTLFSDSTGRYEFRSVGRGVFFIRVDSIGTIYENIEQRIELTSLSSSRIEEPVIVDIVIKAKNNNLPNGQPSTTFSQEVPEMAKKEYERGLNNLKNNKADLAIISFKLALESFADYYDVLEQLGNLYVEQRNYQSAEPLLARAVEVNKNGWRAHYSLGIAQYNLNRRTDAAASLKRAVELNRDSANAYMWLGIVLAQTVESRTDAIKAFERVTQIAKDAVPEAYFYLGSLYSKNNQNKEAADALEHFLRLDPQTGDKDKLKKVIEQLRQKANKK
jgi:tetratricopeptide (TPR) repeat protein